jgi:aminoglycoside 6'-N-acetyltransferase I
MRIIDLHPGYEQIIHEAAAMLVEAFKDHWPDAWPDLEAALEEVHESLGEDRISRIAVEDNGTVLGWIGAIKTYSGQVWELHPLVVSPSARGKGVGRALVADLEERVGERGGSTLWLGSDDEDNMTSIGGIDLYPNPLEHLAKIKNLRGHPYEFYQKLGFTIVGVMPDANGLGKPDIFMAKRIVNRRECRENQKTEN